MIFFILFSQFAPSIHEDNISSHCIYIVYTVGLTIKLDLIQRLGTGRVSAGVTDDDLGGLKLPRL